MGSLGFFLLWILLQKHVKKLFVQIPTGPLKFQFSLSPLTEVLRWNPGPWAHEAHSYHPQPGNQILRRQLPGQQPRLSADHSF